MGCFHAAKIPRRFISVEAWRKGWDYPKLRFGSGKGAGKPSRSLGATTQFSKTEARLRFTPARQPSLCASLQAKAGGRGGIRTHGGLPQARFRVECLKPDSATLPFLHDRQSADRSRTERVYYETTRSLCKSGRAPQIIRAR